MKIVDFQVRTFEVPLKQPFQTALRTAYGTQSVLLTLKFDNGIIGYGEGAETVRITGETMISIQAISPIILKSIEHLDMIEDYHKVMQEIKSAAVHNTNGKAAVDIAIHDALAKVKSIPLYQLLGGIQKEIQTDYTVSINEVDHMKNAAIDVMKQNFPAAKIKLGKGGIEKDIQRFLTIHEAVGSHLTLRVDANQGWNVEETLHFLQTLKEKNIPLEFLEQPVPKYDIDGLKEIKKQSHLPIMADESLFVYEDALRLLKEDAADYWNVKLMKTGGIYEAKRIIDLAQANGIKTMIGCMIESPVGIHAAGHLASHSNVHWYDLDAYYMIDKAYHPVEGMTSTDTNAFILSSTKGLGVDSLCEKDM